MAKTKRRQLAALAAKADGKGLTCAEERIASCQGAGPSGTASHKNDPLVEIRTQRVIIKIPSLPLKAAAAPVTSGGVRRRKRKASSTADLSSKSGPANGAKRNKRKARVDAELKSEDVPADEAKISNRSVAVKSERSSKQVPGGEIKRRRRGASAKSKLNSKHVPADSAKVSRKKVAPETDSKQIPADEAKLSKVILKLGKWRREKTIEELRSPVAEVASAVRQSRTKVTSLPPSRKRKKVQEVMIKSPVEITTEEVATRVPDSWAENGDAALLVALETCSGEPVLSSTNRSLEGASTCNGDGRRNRASSPIHTFRRKRGSAAKAIVEAPASFKNAEREDISRTEIMANGDVPLESRIMRCEKSVTPRPEDLGYTPSDDISTVRNSKDGATSSRAQAEPHIAGSTITGKDVILSGAELIKQNNQLAIINKRLDAAGGLRKWLLDKGLGQFVPIFDDNKIDSLTLLQITMTGLKEMGMIPVGPRRKLMHALSCLTGRSPLTSVGGLVVR